MLAALVAGTTLSLASANEVMQAQAMVPAADRWMYPFNASPGARTVASTFSALPEGGGVDDRFGQFLIKFNTVAAGIPAGLGVENYSPLRVVLTAVIAPSENVAYDPSQDARQTYGPSATADSDLGRPLELHGTEFRNSFTASNFLENSAFGSSAPGARNAYALGISHTGVARDESHHVTQGFDGRPWAIGKIFVKPQGSTDWIELAAGEVIPTYAHAIFELDLTLPGVSGYVKQSFHQGFLWLTLSSLHSVIQQAAAGYPAYFTKEHPEQALYGDVAPSLDVEYALPLRVEAFRHDAAVSEIRWNGSPGFSYQVQASSNLELGSWSNITPSPLTTALPGTLRLEIPELGASRFFRIARTLSP